MTIFLQHISCKVFIFISIQFLCHSFGKRSLSAINLVNAAIFYFQSWNNHSHKFHWNQIVSSLRPKVSDIWHMLQMCVVLFPVYWWTARVFYFMEIENVIFTTLSSNQIYRIIKHTKVATWMRCTSSNLRKK